MTIIIVVDMIGEAAEIMFHLERLIININDINKNSHNYNNYMILFQLSQSIYDSSKQVKSNLRFKVD